MLTQLSDHAERYRRVHIARSPKAWLTAGHREILDAAKAGDRELSAALLADHLSRPRSTSWSCSSRATTAPGCARRSRTSVPAEAQALSSASATRRAERFGAPEVLPWTGESLGRPGPPPPQPERPISAFAHGADAAGRRGLPVPERLDAAGAGPWPVLVWSIGGGWTIGWTGSSIYDGAALAAAAEVVVVSFTYRLGSLGWCARPNWGLLDHVAALEWVRENIAAFGGDPARVTMGGQSAGAANVADLLVCPRGRGPVHPRDPALAAAARGGNDPARRARWAPTSPPAWRSTPRRRTIVAAHEALLARERVARHARRGVADAGPATLPVAPLERPARGARSRCWWARPATRRRSCSAPAARDAPDARGRARSPPSCSPSRLGAGRARGPRRAAKSTCSGSTTRSPDPRLGALHTIDVPLLFGTFRTARSAATTSPTTRRPRAVSEAMQEAWGRFLHGEACPGESDDSSSELSYSSAMTTFIADQMPVTVAAGRAGART